MTTRLLALRPEPGLKATLARARGMGLAITGHALSELRAVAWACPDPAAIDGLLIGSANAILHGGPQLARLAGKPVYAVGKATAASRLARSRPAVPSHRVPDPTSTNTLAAPSST